MTPIAVPNRGLGYAVLAGSTTTLNPDTVSVVTARTGIEYRAVSVGSTVSVQRRTRVGGAWTTIGSRAGAQASVNVDLRGRPQVHLNDGGSIARWDVEAGTVATIATGSNPRTAWNRTHTLECRTRWRGGSLYAEVLDQQGNSLHGEVAVATVAECAGDVDWHLDGRPYIQYPASGSVVEKVSDDNGASWA